MKKIVATIIITGFGSLAAQNVQLHYDLGRARDKAAMDRGYFTSTVEMFKPDKWGSNYFFVDMDYNGKDGNISTAYWEISRDIKLWKQPVALHVEYNGGIFVDDNSFYGNNIKNAYLFGFSSTKKVGAFSLGSYFAYKYFNSGGNEGPDFQWTCTWFGLLANGKITLSGFFDIWTEDYINHLGMPSGKKWVFLSEPQIWYNITTNLAVGSEVEISSNFVPFSNELEIMPTIAAKWNF
jgi:hypothetical protein